MTTKYAKPILVMNIKREYFAAIVDKSKKIEYRELSDYWLRRLQKVEPAPFTLHLYNGMNHPIPEVIIRVKSVRKYKKTGEIRLYLDRILEVRHWDRKRRKPKK